jgi:hypothetical protein
MVCSLVSRGKPKENTINPDELNLMDAENNQLLERDEIKTIIEAVNELYEGKIANEKETRKQADEKMNSQTKNDRGSIANTELIEALSIIQNDIKVAEYFNQRSIECEAEPAQQDEAKIAEFLKKRQMFYDP